MFRSAFVCVLACTFASSATSGTAQILNRTYPGITIPETFLAQSNGKAGVVSFDGFLNSLSAQDIDGDGKIDLLVNGIPNDSNLQGPVTTTLLRNTGSGNFQQIRGNRPDYCIPPAAFWAPPGSIAPFCNLADLNGDGRPDKIFAVEYPNAANTNEVDYPTVKVEFATGPGTFSAPLKYVLGGRHAFIAAMATGDFNGDGRQDIAVLRMSQLPDPATQRFYSYVVLLLGNAQGGFTPTHAYATGVFDDTALNYVGVTSFDLQMFTTDLNGDGIRDLVVFPLPPILSALPHINSPFAVVLGRPDGLTVDTSTNPSPFLSLAPADLNHDAYGDLLASEPDGFHLLFGAGAHSPILKYFSRDVKQALGDPLTHIMTMIAQDLNGDGRPDLIVVTWDTTNILFQKANGSYTDATHYAGGSDVGALLADINGDGHPDIVLVGNPITFLYGDGKGSFAGTRVTSDTFGGAPVTADFNRDGNADVAIVSGNYTPNTNHVDVFAGTGKGWFSPPKSYPVANIYCMLATGDINGDGIPDIVVENALPPQDAGVSGPDTSVLLGRKDGTFAAAVGSTVGLSYINGTSDVFIVDLNNDGKGDLVTDAGVAISKGDGTFGAPIAFLSPASSVAVADFNGDGKPDVLIGTSAGASVLLGDGTGHFTPGQVVDPGCGGGCYLYLAAGKLDANASNDIVLAYADAAGISQVTTYVNDGAGHFTQSAHAALTEPSFSLYSALIAIRIVDMTGDGKNDILFQSAALGVLPGKGDGTLAQPIALGYSSGVFGSQDFALADYNNDGYLDIAMIAWNGFSRLLNTGPGTWVIKP